MLELASNTIKVLGIFGRLSTEQEAIFDSLEEKYSQKPTGTEYDIFRHLTLTFIPNASVKNVQEQLILLKDLKQFLPLKIPIKNYFVKDEESLADAEHVAIEFDLDHTKDLVEYIKQRVSDVSVATWYIKVIWFVPQQNQGAVISSLSELKELQFDDFYLVANKQDEENTIFTTKQFL